MFQTTTALVSRFKQPTTSCWASSCFEHINRLGKYTFAEQETLLRNGLRPLRQPGQAVAPTAAKA